MPRKDRACDRVLHLWRWGQLRKVVQKGCGGAPPVSRWEPPENGGRSLARVTAARGMVASLLIYTNAIYIADALARVRPEESAIQSGRAVGPPGRRRECPRRR
eukprot:15641-Pyramimonas_sp.AAC.2